MNDDELGEVFRDAMRTRLSEIEPSSKLIERVTQIGEPRLVKASRNLRSVAWRRLWLAIPIPVVGAIVALVLALSASEAPPSFAVVVKPGAVFVTVNNLSGVAGANARLRELAVPAIVVPMTKTCSAHVELTYLGVRNQTVRLTRRPLPARVRVLLAARQISPSKVEMAFGRVTGTPPKCVSSQATGPGLPPRSSR